jgi:hypothetical protein
MSLITPPTVKGPDMRVLWCLVCDTLEELPLFDGDPEQDGHLAYLLQNHQFPSGEPHKGHLFRVPQLQWENTEIRRRIIEQFKGGGSKGIAEFDETFYDVKDTFKEDAMTCFNKHLRPKGACPDYKSEKMMLLPNTKAERKDAGLPDPKRAPGPKQYLCSFCPVDSFYAHKARTELGLDK